MNQCVLAVLLSSAILSGCSADKKADAAQPPKAKEGSVAPRAAVVTTPTSEYRVVNVTGGGKLTGTIDFDGVIPADSIIELPADMMGCGQRITDKRVVSNLPHLTMVSRDEHHFSVESAVARQALSV